MGSSSMGKSTSQKIDRYTVVGLALTVFGILFSELSFFFLASTPLTAVGLSSLILGLVTIMIPGNPIPISYVRSMINESYVNVEEILVQFGAKERGFFLPPRDRRVFVYVPISSNPKLTRSLEAWKAMEAPIRILTEVDGRPGLMVFLPVPYDVLSTVEEGMEAEKVLNQVLVEQFEILESVKAIESGSKITVYMTGFRVETEFPRLKNVIGSIPTSIAGCLLSINLKKPVLFIGEELSGRSIIAIFEMLNKNG